MAVINHELEYPRCAEHGPISSARSPRRHPGATLPMLLKCQNMSRSANSVPTEKICPPPLKTSCCEHPAPCIWFPWTPPVLTQNLVKTRSGLVLGRRDILLTWGAARTPRFLRYGHAPRGQERSGGRRLASPSRPGGCYIERSISAYSLLSFVRPRRRRQRSTLQAALTSVPALSLSNRRSVCGGIDFALASFTSLPPSF